jgi:hypothetical protein
MWVFALNDSASEEIIKWTFLFAAPIVLKSIEEGSFSIIYVFAALTALAISTVLKELVNSLASNLSTENWVLYGRLVHFTGFLLLNTILAIRIWTGFVLARVLTTMYLSHLSITAFIFFIVTIVCLSGGLVSVFSPVMTLREGIAKKI